jgi:NAD(P)-dependent dehydrogenase (short-subunit alcohol dehydrogenase family)
MRCPAIAPCGATALAQITTRRAKLAHKSLEEIMANVAIVTGGTGTIGQAIAAKLQARGQIVVAADLDILPVPEGQHFVACDVTDPGSVAALFEQAAALGTITDVVLSHGMGSVTLPGSADPALVSKVIDVNLKGTALVCDRAADYLGADSSILLVSSMSATMGRIGHAYAYQAAKAGIEQLNRIYAIAYGPRGIRVNAVAPGFMEKLMKGASQAAREKAGGDDAIRASLPLKRLVSEDDIAEAVMFLCSPRARAITGVVLPVDSGMRAQ